MRFVNRIKEKFKNFGNPNEPIGPQEFERILDEIVAQHRFHRSKYWEGMALRQRSEWYSTEDVESIKQEFSKVLECPVSFDDD
jgi:hypothetical protein